MHFNMYFQVYTVYTYIHIYVFSNICLYPEFICYMYISSAMGFLGVPVQQLGPSSWPTRCAIVRSLPNGVTWGVAL